MSIEQPNIWEQSENETDEQYKWFQYYVKLDKPRTVIGAYRAYVSDKSSSHPITDFSNIPLPRLWHLASLGLNFDSTTYHESPWEVRAAAYDQHNEDIRKTAEDKLKLSARGVRREFLGKMAGILENVLNNTDVLNPASIRAGSSAFATFMEQSRQEHNDLPVTRRDLTSNDQPLKVVNITWLKPETTRPEDTGTLTEESDANHSS